MRRNDQNLDFAPYLPIKHVVGKAGDAIPPNIRRKYDAMAVRSFRDFGHRSVKGGEIASTEPGLTVFVIGDILKMFDARRRIEEVAHLSSA